MVPLGTRRRRSRDITGAGDGDALQHVPVGGRSTATPAPGVSSGEAIDVDGQHVAKRAAASPFEWTELTFLQIQAGNIGDC